jgi:hypothetical protein
MFLKLGNSYTISLLVTDINGVRITNDSPYVIIKDIGKGTYWNGISWSGSELDIYLEHTLDGVYQYVFTPDMAGVFEITAKSDTYQSSKVETLEVYEEDFASYQWLTGCEFTIKYPANNADIIPQVQICKDIDKTYWYNGTWNITPAYENMTALDGGVVVSHFTPDEDSKYYITILDGENETLMILSATAASDNIAPVVVTDKSVQSTDGTDCTITNDSNIPLSGVKISAYDPLTKELISKTASDVKGKWTLILKPGQYYFVFEKDGYTSIGMQRTVS